MSQGADDSKSKRLNNPAYVYGPMVYQFPPDHGEGGEKEKPKSNQGINYLVLLLIIGLAIGGVILYLKENGIDIRDLSFRPTWGTSPYFGRSGDRILTRSVDFQYRAPYRGRGRVAADSLYLREGPGPEYEAIYLLPEAWEVSLQGEVEQDRYGDAWARVVVDTNQGPQEGWVSQKYIVF